MTARLNSTDYGRDARWGEGMKRRDFIKTAALALSCVFLPNTNIKQQSESETVLYIPWQVGDSGIIHDDADDEGVTSNIVMMFSDGGEVKFKDCEE